MAKNSNWTFNWTLGTAARGTLAVNPRYTGTTAFIINETADGYRYTPATITLRKSVQGKIPATRLRAKPDTHYVVFVPNSIRVTSMEIRDWEGVWNSVDVKNAKLTEAFDCDFLQSDADWQIWSVVENILPGLPREVRNLVSVSRLSDAFEQLGDLQG